MNETIPKTLNEVNEENIDGFFFILRGIGMMYNCNIEKRNDLRDRMEALRKKEPLAIKSIALSTLQTYYEELVTIYTSMIVGMEIFEKEDDE